MAVEERLNPSFDLLKKKKKRKKGEFFLDPWLHSNVHFDSKSGWPSMSFLWQAVNGFEA